MGGFCGCIQDMAVYAPTLYTLSLTPSGVTGKEDDLFIMDYEIDLWMISNSKENPGDSI